MRYTNLLNARTMGLLTILFGIGLGKMPLSEASTQGSCSAEMSQRADSLLAAAKRNWGDLLKHQKAFSACDDGALGEGYSDAVVHLFAQQWGQFSMFVTLAKQQPDFKLWALRHVDATASDEDLHNVVINAKTCTKSRTTGSICKAIERAAADALKESADN